MSNARFVHFTFLPMSMRVLFSSALMVFGLAYVFAMIQLWVTHAGLDGNPHNLSVDDLIIAYSGSKNATRLEAALKGPMSGMLPADEKGKILAWIHKGATKEGYDTILAPIIKQRCLACHDGSNPHLPNLSTFEGLGTVAQQDTGMSIPTLVRVSHIHMFGLTFIFFITGFVFSHAYVRPLWLKCVVLALPFFSILLDVGSWYLTKLNPAFATVVIASGGIMGICFAIQWVVSVWQMWFYELPAELSEREGMLPAL
jgi:hypothetical protein